MSAPSALGIAKSSGVTGIAPGMCSFSNSAGTPDVQEDEVPVSLVRGEPVGGHEDVGGGARGRRGRGRRRGKEDEGGEELLHGASRERLFCARGSRPTRDPRPLVETVFELPGPVTSSPAPSDELRRTSGPSTRTSLT